MKLYYTSGEKNLKEMVLWSGTQKDAKDDRVTMKEMGYDFVETVAVNIPTDKHSLLAFLNVNHIAIDFASLEAAPEEVA